MYQGAQQMSQKSSNIDTEDVRSFWDANPLCANEIPHELGTREYFNYYDPMREAIESVEFSYELHEYKAFKGKKVLDVGSGNGYVLSKYAKEGAETYGVDVTPTAIELCRKRFELLGLKGDFRVADAENLPFENDTFDCVCSMGVLHHVPDTERAVKEILRVLKPGGRLIVMFYHRNSAKYRWKYHMFSIWKNVPIGHMVNEFDGAGNPKGEVYSKQELKELLDGFEDIRMSVGYLESRDIILRGGRFIPNSWFKPLEKFWGWNLYAKARKPLKAGK